MIKPSTIVFLHFSYSNLSKTQTCFPSVERLSSVNRWSFFSQSKWQLWGKGESLQHSTERIVRSLLKATWLKTKIFPRSQGDYITQVSEQIERRIIKRLSLKFSRIERRILGVLSRIDDFLMNPPMHSHSPNDSGTHRNANGTNQGTNDENTYTDPHPEASMSQSQTTRNFGPQNGHDTKINFTACFSVPVRKVLSSESFRRNRFLIQYHP